MRLGVAALIGWMAAVGVYAGGLILGVEISTRTVAIIFASVTLTIAVLARRIALLIIRHVARILADDIEDQIVIPGLMEEVEVDEEDLYLTWLLVDRVIREAVPEVRSVVIVVESEEGVIEYPIIEDADEFNLRGIETGYRVKAVLYNNGLVKIVMSPDMVEKFAKAVEEGGGEAAVVADDEVLIAIYDIAKKAYKVVYKAPDNLAAYAAYKAIMRLARKGVIKAPGNLLELLPFEPSEIREQILHQVREEEES